MSVPPLVVFVSVRVPLLPAETQAVALTMHSVLPTYIVIVLSLFFVVTDSVRGVSCALPRLSSKYVVCSPCVRTLLEMIVLFGMPARRVGWLLTGRT